MNSGTNLKKRWRPLTAYGLLFIAVSLVLLNLVTDALVTRYDATALRDPQSTFLRGMTPRHLGTPSNNKAVLFVHGFIGAQSNFNTLPDDVAAAGWYVETMRLPGHGTSPREFEHTTSDELIAGVRDAVVTLKEKHNTVVIVAHSMGGALATLVASEESVDGLVLCAPFFGLARSSVLGIDTGWLAQRVSPLIRWLPGRPGNGPVAKPEGRKNIDCYGWIPMAGALTALEIMERARKPAVLARITAPVLAIHSTADTVTSQAATEKAISNMTNSVTTTRWLTTSDHVIFWDYEEERVREAILNYLRELTPK